MSGENTNPQSEEKRSLVRNSENEDSNNNWVYKTYYWWTAVGEDGQLKDTYQEIKSLDELHATLAEHELKEIKEAGALFPDQNVELYQTISAPIYYDTSSFTSDQKKAARLSLLDTRVVQTLSDEDAKKAASPTGVTLQIGAFCLCTFIIAVTPLVDQLALVNPETGLKEPTFTIRSVFFVGYGISAILSWTITGIRSSFNSDVRFTDIFSWSQLGWLLLPALSYSYADWASLKVQSQWNASLWKVVKQSKLFLTAFLSLLIFKRKQTSTQWGLIFSASGAVVVFTMVDIMQRSMAKEMAELLLLSENNGASSAVTEGIDDLVAMADGVEAAVSPSVSDWATNVYILLIGMSAITLTTLGGLVSEWRFRRVKYGFITQMAQNRGLMFLISTILFAFEYITREEVRDKGVFGGWHKWVWIQMVLDQLQGWLLMLVLKLLDSVWKTIATTLSLLGTYLLQVYVLGDQFDMTKFTTLCTLSCVIVGFALSKRDEMKILELKRQLEQKD